MSGYRILRAAGGFMTHKVPVGENKAACGHEPKRNHGTKFSKPRGRWMTIVGGYHLVTCQKCQAVRLRQKVIK